MMLVELNWVIMFDIVLGCSCSTLWCRHATTRSRHWQGWKTSKTASMWGLWQPSSWCVCFDQANNGRASAEPECFTCTSTDPAERNWSILELCEPLDKILVSMISHSVKEPWVVGLGAAVWSHDLSEEHWSLSTALSEKRNYGSWAKQYGSTSHTCIGVFPSTMICWRMESNVHRAMAKLRTDILSLSLWYHGLVCIGVKVYDAFFSRESIQCNQPMVPNQSGWEASSTKATCASGGIPQGKWMRHALTSLCESQNTSVCQDMSDKSATSSIARGVEAKTSNPTLAWPWISHGLKTLVHWKCLLQDIT